jgi:transposase
MDESKPKIKKINLLVQVNNNTDPVHIANIIQNVIRELEERGITAVYSKGPVTVDPEGKCDD